MMLIICYDGDLDDRACITDKTARKNIVNNWKNNRSMFFFFFKCGFLIMFYIPPSKDRWWVAKNSDKTNCAYIIGIGITQYKNYLYVSISLQFK